MSTIKDTTKPASSGQKQRRAYASRLKDHQFRLLDLDEIFVLETTDDSLFTLKVLYFAYKMATEFVATEYGDVDLGADVLSVFKRRKMLLSGPRNSRTFNLLQNRTQNRAIPR